MFSVSTHRFSMLFWFTAFLAVFDVKRLQKLKGARERLKEVCRGPTIGQSRHSIGRKEAR
jgi:hypothetical protein